MLAGVRREHYLVSGMWHLPDDTPRALFGLLFALLLVLSQPLCAAVVTGTVRNVDSGMPLANATVTVAELGAAVQTEARGDFSLAEIPAGDYLLLTSHVGYLTDTLGFSVAAEETLALRLYLTPTAILMEGLSVTAARLPVDRFVVPRHVSIVPRAEFSEREGSTTADLLREEAGVLVQKTTHGHGAPILRGLIGKHVLLLYDGLRLNRPTYRFGANQYLNTVDARSLAGIEVVRGPASVVYGSDALGGVVNLIPEVPRAPQGVPLWQAEFESAYRSADDGRAVRLGLGAGQGRVSSTGGLTMKRCADLRAGGEIGKQRPTGWEELALDLHSIYRSGNGTQLRLDYLLMRQDEVPRYDKYVNGEFETYLYDPQNRDLLALTLDSPLSASDATHLKTSFAYQRELEGRTTQETGSSTITYDRDRLTTWGGYAQVSHQLRRHWLSLGGEAYHDKVGSERVEEESGVSTATRPAFPDGSGYLSLGLYFRDEVALSPLWKASAGVRYSSYRMTSELDAPFGEFTDTYTDVSGALSLSYLPREWLHLSAGWSRGFRAPNLNDVVVLKYSSSGVDAPTAGVRPEASHNFELGCKVNRAQFQAETFVFYTLLSDLIDRYPGTYLGLSWLDQNGNGIEDPGEPPIYQRFNVDDARIYGWETRLVWLPDESWQVRSTAAWAWGENQTLHEPLSRIPPLLGSFAVRHILQSGFWLEAYLRAATDQRRMSQRDRDDDRIDPEGTAGWWTANLRAQFGFGQLQLNVALENILDQAYKEHGSGIYSPGRGVSLSLRYAVG